MFCPCVFVCSFICQQNYAKSTEVICTELVELRGTAEGGSCKISRQILVFNTQKFGMLRNERYQFLTGYHTTYWIYNSLPYSGYLAGYQAQP